MYLSVSGCCWTSWPCTLIESESSEQKKQELMRKCDEMWRRVTQQWWLFRKRKAPGRHNDVVTLMKYFWAVKILSLTLCDGGCPPFALIQAISTFSLKPSVFPPLPSARQQFIYIIVYADSFLPPTRTHNDISYWCFLPFSLGSPCFYVSLSSASPLRLRSAKHPLPWIFRSISFSCMHMCMDI